MFDNDTFSKLVDSIPAGSVDPPESLQQKVL